MSLPASIDRAVPALALCLAALAATIAWAADPALKTGSKSPLLTREELRACMNTKASLDQQREQVEQMKAGLDAEKTDIESEGSALKERLAALDRTNKDLVEQFVESNNAHDKRIDAYSARSSTFNAKVDTLLADREAYKRDCENRRFDERDERAIKSGK
jgi:hypothetical protein